jgi:hypothetical protein
MTKSAKSTATASALSLAALVMATQSELGYMHATPAEAKSLLDAGYADMNMELPHATDPNAFAIRATDEGIAALSNQSTAPANSIATTPVFSFEIETIDAPTRKRRSTGSVAYPFAQLPEVGADGKVSAFFVPSTEARPEPWKSLQSTVSAATRSFATKTGENAFTKKNGEAGTRSTYAYTRKFTITEGERQGVKGAWVSRVA